MSEGAERRMAADAADWVRQLLQEEAGSSEGFLRHNLDGIEKMLALKARARVLDLGCGSGRQTIELARRGYRVLGMDFSAAGLAGPRAAIRGQTLKVHFMAGDLRRIPFSEEFAAVVNLQNPIGCFPLEREDLQCLLAVHRALKTGGKLLLDLVNREWLICQFTLQPPDALPPFDVNTGRLDCRSLARAGHSRLAIPGDSLRVYSCTEIRSLLDRAGFAVRHVYGDFEGNPYKVDSLRMIVLAEKADARRAPRKEDDLPRAMRIKGRPK